MKIYNVIMLRVWFNREHTELKTNMTRQLIKVVIFRFIIVFVMFKYLAFRGKKGRRGRCGRHLSELFIKRY